MGDKEFKMGDSVNLLFNSKVKVNINDLEFDGIIVGKATTDINQTHIVKCIDGTLPNDTYKYDTISVPLCLIKHDKDMFENFSNE